jgi:hypothetical protein
MDKMYELILLRSLGFYVFFLFSWCSKRHQNFSETISVYVRRGGSTEFGVRESYSQSLDPKKELYQSPHPTLTHEDRNLLSL